MALFSLILSMIKEYLVSQASSQLGNRPKYTMLLCRLFFGFMIFMGIIFSLSSLYEYYCKLFSSIFAKAYMSLSLFALGFVGWLIYWVVQRFHSTLNKPTSYALHQLEGYLQTMGHTLEKDIRDAPLRGILMSVMLGLLSGSLLTHALIAKKRS